MAAMNPLFSPRAAGVALAGLLAFSNLEAGFVTRAADPIPGIIEISNVRQQFLDDLLIFESSQIYKFVGRPEKYAKNPVLVPDKPWEMGSRPPTDTAVGNAGLLIQGQIAIYDQEERLFKIWYLASSFIENGPVYWCYATSKDGYNWEKPNLGVYEYQGSKNNNIVADWGDPNYTNVIKDAREPDPQKRYKAFGELENGGANTKGGLSYAYSPDGIHWIQYPKNPVIAHGRNMADSPIGILWDSKKGKYVHYPRPGHPLAPEFNGTGDHRHIRAIGYTESDDCINWTPTVPMLTPNEEDRGDDQYMEFVSALDGEFYIGINSVYQTHEQTWDSYLMTSRDGFHWNWVDHKTPLIGRGEVGTYDAGYQSPSGPIFHDGKIWLFYGCFSGAHSLNQSKLGKVDRYGIAVCTLPDNRWMGLLAGPHRGTIVTRPIVFQGNAKFLVDVDASLPMQEPRTPPRYDECALRVAILDQSGAAIPGFTIDRSTVVARSGVQEIKWKGKDVASLAGRPIRLRFEMVNAALYSFQFAVP